MTSTGSSLQHTLRSLDGSAPSVKKAASAMMKHYDKTAIMAVTEWRNVLSTSHNSQQLISLLYVANEVLQISKRNRGNKYLEAFSSILGQALQHICQQDNTLTDKVRRTIKIWGDRRVFSIRFVQELLSGLEPYRQDGKGTGGTSGGTGSGSGTTTTATKALTSSSSSISPNNNNNPNSHHHRGGSLSSSSPRHVNLPSSRPTFQADDDGATFSPIYNNNPSEVSPSVEPKSITLLSDPNNNNSNDEDDDDENQIMEILQDKGKDQDDNDDDDGGDDDDDDDDDDDNIFVSDAQLKIDIDLEQVADGTTQTTASATAAAGSKTTGPTTGTTTGVHDKKRRSSTASNTSDRDGGADGTKKRRRRNSTTTTTSHRPILSTNRLLELTSTIMKLQDDYEESQRTLERIDRHMNKISIEELQEIVGDELILEFRQLIQLQEQMITEKKRLQYIATRIKKLEHEIMIFLPWLQHTLDNDISDMEYCIQLQQQLQLYKPIHEKLVHARTIRRIEEQERIKKEMELERLRNEKEESERFRQESMKRQTEQSDGMVWNPSTREYQQLDTNESWRD